VRSIRIAQFKHLAQFREVQRGDHVDGNSLGYSRLKQIDRWKSLRRFKRASKMVRRRHD
jgi:hypothetical protein